MSYTRRDLVVKAYRLLTSSAQEPNDDDYNVVDGYVDGVLEALDYRDIVSVQNQDEIEPRFFQPLAVCVAEASKYEFGGASFDIVKAEQDLLEMNASRPTYAPLKANYF